jgi:hypothetical protein
MPKAFDLRHVPPITLGREASPASNKKAGHQPGFLPHRDCIAQICYGSWRYKTLEHIC